MLVPVVVYYWNHFYISRNVTTWLFSTGRNLSVQSYQKLGSLSLNLSFLSPLFNLHFLENNDSFILLRLFMLSLSLSPTRLLTQITHHTTPTIIPNYLHILCGHLTKHWHFYVLAWCCIDCLIVQFSLLLNIHIHTYIHTGKGRRRSILESTRKPMVGKITYFKSSRRKGSSSEASRWSRWSCEKRSFWFIIQNRWYNFRRRIRKSCQVPTWSLKQDNNSSNNNDNDSTIRVIYCTFQNYLKNIFEG